MDVSKKETIVFLKDIGANSTGQLEERIKADGTIEKVTVRFYAGVQRSLRINPIVMHKGNKSEGLVTYPENTDPYVSGDDDLFVFDTVIPIENDDTLVIKYNNTDPANIYTLAVYIEVDYYGGKNRVVGGVL